MKRATLKEPDYSELEQLISQRVRSHKTVDIPSSLYHYTSSAAFLSIVEHNAIWFSDFRYMNDLSEMRYGVDLFLAELEKREADETTKNWRALFAGAREQFERAFVYTDVFIFCMCEENNLLNQWRVYGRDTVPLCLELPTEPLVMAEWTPYRFELISMVYDAGTQQKIVKDCIDLGVRYARRHQGTIFDDNDALRSYLEMWVAICVDWCTALKHPQFAVEKEWRLSIRWGLETRPMTGRHFRTSPAGIVPYIIMKPEEGRIPIRSVTIGPCNHPDIQRRTIVDYLHQMDRTTTQVHLSNLPVRV
ncbi:DUF2971 domain-containing protein [Bradyrhizobium sp. LTSP857]|uniref:DUF2971 domain-containing protein n=1 Tax=Bradyrhizobium sp. LTSP857 TaxID=1619231 RepID=UPI000ABCAD85|nr:DUF2971 domain-containing protein [Bradyrhizobium sp. LTSP857]